MEEQEASKPNFAGRWDFLSSENFEDYLRENGANWIARKMAGASKPSLEVIQEGNKFTIKLITMLFTREETFTIGEEFEKEQHSGDKMKIMPQWDGNKIVLDYTPCEGATAKPQTVTREIEGDQLITTMKVGNVVAKRIFKRPSSVF